MTMTTAIAAAEKELVMREHAASHLKGIPALQNATAISRLYDALVNMHIAQYEQEAKQ